MPMIVGGSDKPVYSASTTLSAVSANRVHLAIWNGGTVPLEIYQIGFHAILTATVTGYPIGLYVIRTTSMTGGTTVSIARLDQASAVLPGVTVLITPTVGNTQAIIDVVGLNTEETGGSNSLIRNYCSELRPIVVNPGEGLAIVQYGTAGAGSVGISIFFGTR